MHVSVCQVCLCACVCVWISLLSMYITENATIRLEKQMSSDFTLTMPLLIIQICNFCLISKWSPCCTFYCVLSPFAYRHAVRDSCWWVQRVPSFTWGPCWESVDQGVWVVVWYWHFMCLDWITNKISLTCHLTYTILHELYLFNWSVTVAVLRSSDFTQACAWFIKVVCVSAHPCEQANFLDAKSLSCDE